MGRNYLCHCCICEKGKDRVYFYALGKHVCKSCFKKYNDRIDLIVSSDIFEVRKIKKMTEQDIANRKYLMELISSEN